MRARIFHAAMVGLMGALLLGASSTGANEAHRTLARAPSAKTPLAIVNGRLIDGTGARPLKNAVVLIRGKRIVYAGPRKRVKIPKRAKRIDVRGATILPGFINTHIHQAYSREELRAWLMGGVTTVRDLGSGTEYEGMFSYRDGVNKGARTARLLAVGPLVTVPDGYPMAIWGSPGLEVASPADARAKVERLIHAGCDTVKISVESGETFGKELPVLSREEIKAIVEVAHAHGKRVSAHAMMTADFERAVAGGVDEIAHYNLSNTPQSLIERMVRERVVLVPTLELFHVVRATIMGDTLKRFVRAGGIVALGTDYMGAGPEYRYELGMPVNELVYMDQLGMTPMQAIKAATKNAAYTLGHPELGVIRKGKIADVIAVKGNPLGSLEVLRKVSLVVHNGVVVKSKLR